MLRRVPRRRSEEGRIWRLASGDSQPLKGAADFEELAALLKRCPDTKHLLFRSLLGRTPVLAVRRS